MANIIFADSCDGYSNSTGLEKLGWVRTGTINILTTGGRYGGGAFSIVHSNAGGARRITRSLGDIVATGKTYFHFHLKISSSDGTWPASQSFFVIGNNGFPGTDTCAVLRINTSRALVVENAAGASVFTSSSNALVYDQWHTIEVEAEIGQASGDFTLWLDGVQLYTTSTMDLTDGDTGPATWFQFAKNQNTTPTLTLTFDDVIVADAGGDTPFGPKRMYSLLPTSDQSVAWTPFSGGTNYVHVDEALNGNDDGDSSYVFKSFVERQDFYGFEDLPDNVSNVEAVLAFINARLETPDSTEVLSWGAAVRIGTGTTLESNTLAASSIDNTYARTVMVPFPLDPASATWTRANVNNIQAGPHAESTIELRVSRFFLSVIADDPHPPKEIEASGGSVVGGGAGVTRTTSITPAGASAADGAGAVARTRAIGAEGPSLAGGEVAIATASTTLISAAGGVAAGGQVQVEHYEPTEIVTAPPARLLEQFKRKPKWTAWLESMLRQVEEARLAAIRVRVETQLANARQADLDMWGRVLLQPRLGLDDDDYRMLLQARLLAKLSNGSVPALLKMLRAFMPEGTEIRFSPSRRASMTVYITPPNGQAINWVLVRSLLDDARAGGVRVMLGYTSAPEDEMFAFSDDGTVQADADRGWSDTTQAAGGRFAGVI